MLLWSRVLENIGPAEQTALLGPNPNLDEQFDFLAQGLELWENGRLHQRIGELSGGQLKRFGLLLRLPFYAPILVLDEPDTGLDLERAENLIAFLQSEEYSRAFHRPPPAILMVTHNDSLRRLADETVTFQKVPDYQTAQAYAAKLQAGSPAAKPAPPSFADEAPPNFFQRTEAFLDAVFHRAIRECQHQLSLFLRSFQNFSVLWLAPILIFSALMLCELMDPREGITTDATLWDQRFAKYAFFAVVASVWLGLQLYGKIMVADAILLKEEFSWIANLRGGWRRVEKTHILGVGLGLILTVLVTSLLQSLLGVAIFFCQPFGWAAHNWSIFPMMFVPLFMAFVYGGALGLALGAVVACWQLDVWRPPAKTQSHLGQSAGAGDHAVPHSFLQCLYDGIRGPGNQ